MSGGLRKGWNTFGCVEHSATQAALYLIHEALHYAGLPEWPPHPGAPTSNEIQRLVQQTCGGPRSGPKTPGTLKPSVPPVESARPSCCAGGVRTPT